jgi:predicted ATPase
MDGQQSAALTQYASCRQLLEEELGVEPSDETNELYERIRSGEFALPAAQIVMPASRPLHNLAADRTEFVGREQELKQGLEHLADPGCRLLTITGVGGIGKTRLARQIARNLADTLTERGSERATPVANGVFLVALAGLEPGEQNDNLLAVTIADSLQLPLSGSEAPSTQLLNALYGQRLLLVLDNFEQLTGAAPYIVTLLEQVPGLKLLVTSRVRLNIRGEQVISLNGLAIPDATQIGEIDHFAATRLFLTTARSVTPNLALTAADQRAIIATCRMVNGMPLGIELAASWTRLLSCQDILSEIKENMDFLNSTMPDLPDRHRSLRAVFDQSWGLLGDDERAAMQRLSIFRGGFTRQACEAVTGTRLETLMGLIDKSLVKRSDSIPAESDTAGPIRFELLEILRQYAWEQLEKSGGLNHTAWQHARFYADFMQEYEANLRGGNQQAALDAIAAEIENLRAASRWGAGNISQEPQLTLELAAHVTESLFHFYDMRSWFQEGETFFGNGVELLVAQEAFVPDSALSIQRARFQARQGWFKYHLAQYEESEALLRTSLETLQAEGQVDESIFSLNYLAAVINHVGRADEAKPYLDLALDLARDLGDRFSASITYNIMAQIAGWQGDLEGARRFSRQALETKRAISDRRGMFYSLSYLGNIALGSGDYAEASSLLNEALSVGQEIGDRRAIATALMNLADTAQAQGDVVNARRIYQESLEIFRNIGDQRQASMVLTRLGEQANAQGDYGVAAISLREALYIARSIDSRPALTTALLGMLDWLTRRDQVERATGLLSAIQKEPSLGQEQVAYLDRVRSEIDQAAHSSGRQDAQSPQIEFPASMPELVDQVLAYLADSG